MHGYSVDNHPRAKIMFLMSLMAISITPKINELISKILTQIPNNTISLSIGCATIFTIVYILFDRFLWKIVLRKIFNYPNFSGTWGLTGLSNKPTTEKKYEWTGKIVITQTWSKIIITLTTDNSTSKSVSITGGVNRIPGVGYTLSYHYSNYPNKTGTELKKHDGFCILDFDEKIHKATGRYFTDADRNTSGTMELTKREK
ncbi:MAG TPA: hypothetical protein PKU84_13925 [Spirochaetota bacterium]|nr:hypothetical protein [Spirochaetota bacterium]HPK57590.1 hypothetical protein [Spirochaetota bacterium]